MNFLALNNEQLQFRREEMESDILLQWSRKMGYEYYYVQCACQYDCPCKPSILRLTLERCYYNPEFNIVTLSQPFLATYGFKIFWYCLGLDCENELACCDGQW